MTTTPPEPTAQAGEIVERESRFWLVLQEPGRVPERKGSWPRSRMASILREFINARPTAYIHVLTIDSDGHPDVEHGPEVLQMLDGRSMSTGRKHNRRTREAHASHHGAALSKGADDGDRALVERSGEAHIAAELREIAKETGCGQRQMHLEIAAQIIEQGQFLHPSDFAMAIAMDDQADAIEALSAKLAAVEEGRDQYASLYMDRVGQLNIANSERETLAADNVRLRAALHDARSGVFHDYDVEALSIIDAALNESPKPFDSEEEGEAWRLAKLEGRGG